MHKRKIDSEKVLLIRYTKDKIFSAKKRGKRIKSRDLNLRAPGFRISEKPSVYAVFRWIEISFCTIYLIYVPF